MIGILSAGAYVAAGRYDPGRGARAVAGLDEDVIRTAADHRIAMSFAIAALTGVAGTVEIDDPACAAVSYPTFWTDMEHLAS